MVSSDDRLAAALAVDPIAIDTLRETLRIVQIALFVHDNKKLLRL
jgi:hypothetical protein